MSELVRRTTGEVDPADAARLSRSKLMPKDIAGDSITAEYIMRFGAALGIDPMSSFQHIYVFPDGKGRLKAGMSAHLMQALAIAAGHTVTLSGNAMKANAVLIRKASEEDLNRFQRMREEERRQKLARLEDLDRLYKMQRGQILERIQDLQSLGELGAELGAEEIPGLHKQLGLLHGQYDFEALRSELAVTQFDLTSLVRFESEWTMMRAASIEGLTTKNTWKSYGPEMLKSRAKASVVRDGAIDVILGVRNILSAMGLNFSDSDHDDLAVSSALYTPEELGADVNEEGVPIEGEVIDVTEAKASKAQAALMRLAEGMVDKGSAEQLARWALKTAADSTISVDDKISRIYAVQKAAHEAGKGGEEVAMGEEPVPLSTHLEHTVQSLRS